MAHTVLVTGVSGLIHGRFARASPTSFEVGRVGFRFSEGRVPARAGAWWRLEPSASALEGFR